MPCKREDMQKREDERKKQKRFEISKPSESETEVNFVLEKVSKRHVRKYGVNSCVYQAHLEDSEGFYNVKIKDILSELSNLFDTVVDNVKKQCGLDRLSNDKMRIMVTSSALKSPISTRFLPSGDMSA